MLKRVLIANRGEIAIRVIRALRELEITSVAVYSDSDKDSLHVLYADLAYPLHGDKALDTYMNVEKIVKLAKNVGADAIHPGYGFLSEKAEFAKACEQAGIIFIGPHSEVMALMGNKIAARKLMLSSGVPVVPGTEEAVSDLKAAREIAAAIGYPVLIKAAAGGGGVGMRVVQFEEEFSEMLERAQQQAGSVFGDSSVFIEKCVENPRHIEFQILGDKFGNIVHLGERECSIQRRYQKIIEESPSTALTPEMRQKMGQIALTAANAVNYQGAGTIEFIYSNGEFYFLEMNTRIQVEHPVTELLTCIDLVKSQIKIAAGEPLPFRQEDICFNGHVIECRICAEDPLNGFSPSPNKIVGYRSPGGFGIRIDSGVHLNYEIPTHYDSMISKLLAWGGNREEAIARMRRALREYIIMGPKTNIPYLRAVMDSAVFKRGEINTKFIEEHSYLFEDARILAAKDEATHKKLSTLLRIR
ncbi:MAG: 2-oxoglutarate carboxylase small subunit [Syntrophomonadaceae bacterium]|nr:2-oxoglutarate carboxylase small subunit [Bacillota bacterium]